MKRVLVVDDTKNIRILLSKCLELEGYEVSTACDGLQAMEMFKSEKFDLAFLDIKMPQFSGTEVLKRVREAGINTPIIIITAYATIKNAVECTQMGAVAYLQKPFTADKVRSVLGEMLHLPCKGIEEETLVNIIKRVEEALVVNDFSYGIELLKKAIAIDPANIDIYLLFSKAYQGVGDNENAKKFYAMYQALKIGT
jgi:two-component system, OmpR family, response regulator